MSINLVEAAKGLFTNEIVNKASSYLGENSSGITKAISGSVPAIFLGLADKSATTEGATTISQLAQEQNNSGILNNIGNFFDGDNSGILGRSSGLLGSIFGSKSDGITKALSNFAGIKSSSISTLLAMATPMILSFLGRHMKSNNLSAGGLATMLAGQRQHIADAMPDGLNLQSFFGHSTAASKPVHSATASHPRHVETSSGGTTKWLLPVLLLALLGAAAWYFFKDGCNKKEEVVAISDTTSMASPEVNTTTTTTTPATGAAGTVDSLGNFIYNVGNMVTIDLPNNAGKLEVGENSTEAKLVRFLQSNDMVDTAKGNWFDFTNVRFRTGSSVITEESMTQLKNLVLITKAFPDAQFKVGGYTDNTGDAAKNVALSKDRAAAVAAKVKSLGATAKSIVGSDGYGEQFPIGDNSTAEGRAQNRRVSVNVKAK